MDGIINILKIIFKDDIVVAHIVFFLLDRSFNELMQYEKFNDFVFLVNKNRWLINDETLTQSLRYPDPRILGILQEDYIKGREPFCVNVCLKEGLLESLKWISQECNVDFKEIDIRNVAEFGFLFILKWLKNEHDVECNDECLNLATINGHLHVLKWMKKDCKILIRPFVLYNIARRYNHYNIIEWLKYDCKEKNIWIYDYRSTNEANMCAKHGDLNGVKWLYEKCNVRCDSKGANWAYDNNHFDVLKWLKDVCWIIPTNF